MNNKPSDHDTWDRGSYVCSECEDRLGKGPPFPHTAFSATSSSGGAAYDRLPLSADLGANMITLDDCIGLCGLTEEEVLAIAEHEHLSEIAAAALAQYLLSQEHGSEKVRDMIVDDIRQAQLTNYGKKKVLMLLHVLHHYLKTHPEARPPNHPWSKRF